MGSSYQKVVLTAEDLAPVCADPITEAALERMLGFKTHNFERFKTCFIHEDVAAAVGMQSYDRFEFLGDSVINMVVAKFLYDRFRDEQEGFLTKSRSKLVCTKSLALMSANLGLPGHVVMTKRAFDTSYNLNPSVAEDVFEAIVGCIYETHGLLEAKRFFLGNLDAAYGEGYSILFDDDNYKDAIMRMTQVSGLPLPTYHTTPPLPGVPPNSQGYGVSVMIGDVQAGFGRAAVKKAAEQLAARAALGSRGLLNDRGYVENAKISRNV
jgi:ribonuclease-3